MKRILSALAITSCLLTGLPVVTLAQGLPGFTLFGGPKSENQLNYRLDFGGRSSSWDRYRFRISSKKMKLAVSQFSITYPDYYSGTFDPTSVEVVVGDQSVPLQEVKWSQENRVLEILPKEPVPAGKDVELIFSNVKNPDFGGIFYFNCNILAPGDVPLLRYIGTWVVSID